MRSGRGRVSAAAGGAVLLVLLACGSDGRPAPAGERSAVPGPPLRVGELDGDPLFAWWSADGERCLGSRAKGPSSCRAPGSEPPVAGRLARVAAGWVAGDRWELLVVTDRERVTGVSGGPERPRLFAMDVDLLAGGARRYYLLAGGPVPAGPLVVEVVRDDGTAGTDVLRGQEAVLPPGPGAAPG
ncbi:hypothetical protein [Kitasatospora sp. NPDC004272]